jgi:hypothetical protein
LPKSIVVRELHYQLARPGCRTREVTLVTTLLDPVRYPAIELAELYGQRWQIETNLRHLKQTLHMDVLRSKTVAGIQKELTMFALVYNLVRLVMLRAAAGCAAGADQLHRRLALAEARSPLPDLQLVPRRPGRHDPRVRKRRPKPYDLMNKPRNELREALTSQQQRLNFVPF